jgi:hypothetical protein
MRNISLGTAWTKYIIPIPNASKLLQEKGMFRYSAGTQGTNGAGYTFWIDELKFEKLGTILPLQASIMNGANVTRTTFVGVEIPVTGAIATFNISNLRLAFIRLKLTFLTRPILVLYEFSCKFFIFDSTTGLLIDSYQLWQAYGDSAPQYPYLIQDESTGFIYCGQMAETTLSDSYWYLSLHAIVKE